MCDTEGNKHICIFDNLFDCRQPYQHIHPKEKKANIAVYKFKKIFGKETSTYSKRKEIIFNLF